MNTAERIDAIEAALVSIGITGSALEAIVALIRVHARPEMARQIGLALSPGRSGLDIGEIAALFLDGSLRRKELLGHAADDPSWNMLLAMFSDEERGARTTVSAACQASGAAPTTALRHVDSLVRSGLVKRTPDPMDLRRSFLTPTPATMGKMAELIRSFCVEPPVNSRLFAGLTKQ